MIALIVSYKCKPGQRETFLNAIKNEKLDEKSRLDAGNIRYRYACADDDPDTLFLLEQWESEELLNAHLELAHVSRIRELKSLFVEDSSLEKYEA